MQGNLFIVSAPSGTGKTSLVRAMMERLGDTAFSVSHTTRAMRPGEQDGRDYHFVAVPAFEAMIAAGEFLEHARVFDNFYGTARASVEAQLVAGQDVFLDIDWQGARQVRHAWPGVTSIFILPPSLTALESRLRARGQDSDEIIARRMAAAISESGHYNEYDYLIINDTFPTALEELIAIVRAQRLHTPQQTGRHADLLAALLASTA